MEDRMVRVCELRRRTGLGRTTIFEQERLGLFPRRRRLAKNAVGWLESEILEWLRTREIGSPPAPTAALRARGIASPKSE